MNVYTDTDFVYYTDIATYLVVSIVELAEVESLNTDSVS